MLVTTFYSFKGGVGRTMLLANVGALLARRGRVLLWDLDLEAPGMHRIPALAPAHSADGFLEWMGAWQEAGRPLPVPAPLRERLAACVCATPAHASLFILPAFAGGVNFARLYNAVDWAAILVDDPTIGARLFHEIVAILGAAHGLDHLLVDARTGITDLGALLAAVVPDATVLVGNLAWQNTYGLRQIKEALEPAAEGRLPDRGDAAPLELLMVASPVPADPVRRGERRAAWDTMFKARPFVEVPFDERLLFEETLLALTEEHAPASEAYRKVADRIDALRREKRARLDVQAPPPAVEDSPAPSREGGFQDRVARLLELGGYAVERGGRDGAEDADLVVTRTSLFSRERLVVECKEGRGAVGKAVIEGLHARAAAVPGAAAMIVARAFTAAAREAAAALSIHATTVAELERQLFDPSAYLAKLRTTFEAGALARTYVPQRVRLESAPEAPVDLLPHAHAWARGAGNPLWVLLGDYGTGKTALFKRLAYELALRAEEDPEAPFPIAVDLKRFPNAITLEGLLQEHLRAELGWHGNPALVLELLSAGRVVLLLDAFDEMGVAAVGRGVDDQLRQLLSRAAEPPWEAAGNRVLLTCRTHFFRDERQLKDATHGEDDARGSGDSALGEVARAYRATIDELALLDAEQVDTFLKNHLGDARAAEARTFIGATYGLASLAPRPVLLEMIIASLPRLVEAGGAVTVSKLYETYTGDWLRAQQTGALATTSEQRARVLRLLARELWGRPERRIHHRDLLSALRAMPTALFAGLDLDRVDLELRTAAFLTRTADGHYGFSHKSFLEFFLAKHVASAVGAGAPDDALADALDTERLSYEVVDFVVEMCGEAGHDLAEALRGVLRAPYRARTSENALRLAVVLQDRTRVRVVPEGAQLAGAQLAEEDLSGVDLSGAELTGAVLIRADLRDAVLREARLVGANLNEAQLDGAALSKAHLDEANLVRAVLREVDLRGSDLTGVAATGAVFVGADLTGALLTRAALASARFARARLRGVDWSGADTTASTAPGCEGPLPPGVRAIPPRLGWWLESGAKATVVDLFAQNRAAVGANDGTVRVFDLAAARLVRVWSLPLGTSVRWLAWSPKGDALLVAAGEHVVHFAAEGAGLSWSIRVGHAPHAAWFPDGSRAFACGAEGTWEMDARSGEARRVDENGAQWVDVSPSGNSTLAIPVTGGAVRIRAEFGEMDLVVAGRPQAATFLDDERIVIAAYGAIRIIRFDGVILAERELASFRPTTRRGPGGVNVNSWSDSRFVDASTLELTPIRCDGAGVSLLGPTGFSFSQSYMGSLRFYLGDHGRGAYRAGTPTPAAATWTSFAVREGMVLYASQRDALSRWGPHTHTFRPLEMTEPARALAWSPEGFPVALSLNGALHVWEGPDPTVLDVSRRLVSLFFGPKGRLLVPTGTEGENEWLDLHSGERSPGPTGRFLASSPDGRLLAAGGDKSTMELLETESGATHEFEVGVLNGRVSFSPSSRRLLVPGLQVLSLYDTTTAALLATFPRADAHALSLDDSTLARIVDSTLFLHTVGFDADPVTHALGVPAHSVAFLDADHLVVLHVDLALRLWNVHTGAMIRAHLPTSSGWVTVEADGRHRGEKSGLRALVYYDPDEESATPTTWLAEDLPELRLPD